MNKRILKQRLIAQGFESTYITRNGVHPVCDNCQAIVIQGLATHETGCSNRKRECEGCSNLIPIHFRVCDDCYGEWIFESGRDK